MRMGTVIGRVTLSVRHPRYVGERLMLTLPWNREKTWSGSLCFLLAAIPIATLYYWGEARPGVTWHVALLCAGTAAVVSAIAESVSSRINDNIRVGVTALVMLVIMNHFLLGWS